jgi:drug/metabolite transporter (DMT)-like permease
MLHHRLAPEIASPALHFDEASNRTSPSVTRTRADLILLIAAVIWGLAFVAQSTAMVAVPPLVFIACRFTLASLVLAPLAWWEHQRAHITIERKGVVGMIMLGVVFFIGAILQQTALLTTSVTNTGFLTSLYVVFTPIVGVILHRQRPHALIWLGIVLAMAGTWLLSGGVSDMRLGDVQLVLSALCWTGQVIMVGRLVRLTERAIGTVFMQMAVSAILGIITSLIFDSADPGNIADALPQLLYTGIMSGGVAFALQAIGQRFTPNSDAAIILSAEAPFAAIFGALILGERLTITGGIGCALIFAAILLVQLIPSEKPS